MLAWAGGRSSPQLLSMKTLVLMPACTGVVGVAHSRAPRIGRNRGIMRKSNSGSDHGSAPMCADLPHCTWEPDRHTRQTPEKPVISTKNSAHHTKARGSHVQHRRQPHPSGTPHPTQPTHHKLERKWTDLGAECDRFRRGLRPISTRTMTDLAAEPDRSRRSLLDTAQRCPIGFSGSPSQEVQTDAHHHGRDPEHDEGRQVA